MRDVAFGARIPIVLNDQSEEAPRREHCCRETLFDHINIKPENVHIPDGTLPPDDVEEYCSRYEQLIRRSGGIDLQILGIGRSGHIGFNEPGSTRHSRTRAATLDPVTALREE